MIFQGVFGIEFVDSFAISRQSTCQHIAIFEEVNTIFSASQLLDSPPLYLPSPKKSLPFLSRRSFSLLIGYLCGGQRNYIVAEQCADTDSVSLIQPNQGQITKLKSVHIS